MNQEIALPVLPDPCRTSIERGHQRRTAAATKPPQDRPKGAPKAKPRSGNGRPEGPVDEQVSSDGAPVGGASFVEALCTRHQDWVTNEVTGDRLPIGWRVLVEQVFADLAKAAGDRRYALRRLEAEEGTLAITLAWLPSAQTSPDVDGSCVRQLVDCARFASRRLCQVCGRTGWRRSTPGAPTLCAVHAQVPEAVPASASGGEDASRSKRAGHRTPSREDASEPMTTRVQLYRISDVATALGPQADQPNETDGTGATEHAGHLRRILERGEAASWRTLAVPTHAQLRALDDLGRRAPHFRQVTDFVHRHVAASIAMEVNLTLPALMLVGEAGFGKSWYVSRLGAALGLPVRTLSMNSTSVGDGLTGAFPVWRNARAGLVARTLLAEAVANPLFLVDEIDKPAAYNGEDPYRPFYTLLEPENARALTDDYLGFPLNASHAFWVLAGNSVQNLPTPILDRLIVMTIPAMDEAQRRIVIASVYVEANAAKRGFFEPLLPDGVADRLVHLTARGMRRGLGEAMVRAAAAGRRVLVPDDVVDDRRPARRPIGFGSWS